MCVVVVIIVMIMAVPPVARVIAARSDAKVAARETWFSIGIPNRTSEPCRSTDKRGWRQDFARFVANGIQFRTIPDEAGVSQKSRRAVNRSFMRDLPVNGGIPS